MTSENDLIVRVGNFGINCDFELVVDRQNFLLFEKEEAKRVAEWAVEFYPKEKVWVAHRDSEDARKQLPLPPGVKEFIIGVKAKFFEGNEETLVSDWGHATKFTLDRARKVARQLIGIGHAGVYVAHENHPFRSVIEL
jgi:hypothetical protein